MIRNKLLVVQLRLFLLANTSLLTKNSRNFANKLKGYFAVNSTSRQTGHSSSLLAELIMSGSSVSLLLVRYPATTKQENNIDDN